MFVASASASGLVMTPVAVLAVALGAWRFGADLGWTTRFFIVDELLSRYQSWLAVAAGAQTSAFLLNRWVARQDSDVSGGRPSGDI
jgi:hypothetical protein